MSDRQVAQHFSESDAGLLPKLYMSVIDCTKNEFIDEYDCFKYDFADEQDFKMAWIEYLHRQVRCDVFEIENEEKEPGFPDLLCVDLATSHAQFFEIKVASKGGIFKFEPTQPRFYKLHPFARIMVVVWDAEQRKVYTFGAQTACDAVLRIGKATPKGIYLNVREI